MKKKSSPNKTSSNVSSKVVEESKIFYDITNAQLDMIFEHTQKQGFLLKQHIPDILDIFFVQIIVPYEERDLEEDEIEKILENYKCVYEELSIKQNIQNITKINI